MIVLQVLTAYAVLGSLVAVPFAVFGISRVVPRASVTAGARLLLLPGAAALWPLVLARWLGSRRSR